MVVMEESAGIWSSYSWEILMSVRIDLWEGRLTGEELGRRRSVTDIFVTSVCS